MERTLNQEMKTALIVANKIACAYADFVANTKAPLLVYDSSSLPYPKQQILAACQLWISACQDAQQLESWGWIFPLLAYYQDGVGKTPLGFDHSRLDMASPTLAQDALAMMIPPQLKATVENEFQELLEWVRTTAESKKR